MTCMALANIMKLMRSGSTHIRSSQMVDLTEDAAASI
jgi:hypothetical protein